MSGKGQGKEHKAFKNIKILCKGTMTRCWIVCVPRETTGHLLCGKTSTKTGSHTPMPVHCFRGSAK